MQALLLLIVFGCGAVCVALDILDVVAWWLWPAAYYVDKEPPA